MSEFISRIDDSLTEEALLKKVNFLNLPRHVAIIMDGNRRWAKEKGYPTFMGHRQGAEAFRKVMVGSRQLGIKILTVYAFSRENWKRTKEEIDFIMELFVEYCNKEKELMKSIGARFNVMGVIDNLSLKVRKTFGEIAEYTKDCNDLLVNVCVNYGSRFEIIQAVQKAIKDVEDQKIKPEDINEGNFSQYLYTAGMPDPDLMIRTSGELRISNFLLWQNAYAEFWFTNLYWPDFDKRVLLQAIIDYQKRERRFGAGMIEQKV